MPVHERRCCTTLTGEDSHRESKRLDGQHEQAITRPLSHDELIQLHCRAAQARVSGGLAGQGLAWLAPHDRSPGWAAVFADPT